MEEEMNKASSPLDKHLARDPELASRRFAFHCAHPDVSYEDYRESQCRKIHDSIKSKHIIYLDTNAWKCLSDHDRGKTLPDAMHDFARAMTGERVLSNCVFPIGITTVFELQSMDDPLSLSTLVDLVDKFSAHVACRPPDEIVERELALFNRKETRDAGAEPERFCHPMDIMGNLDVALPNLLPAAETLAYRKTILDISHALPISAHLEIAATSELRPWDNSDGITEMNEGMIAHRHEPKTYADMLFIELSGIMKFHVPDGPLIQGFLPHKYQALVAMSEWHDNPNSKHLMTARIQANIHAIVRHIELRKFQKGDIPDILTAAVALPSAHALFTDKRLANLLNEPKIGLKKFCSCEVLSGFENFAAHLRAI